MEDSFPQPNSLRSPSAAEGSRDGIPGRSLGLDPSSSLQAKWIAETRSHRYSLSGRSVISPIGFLKIVSLTSQCEELCTARFCVEPGAGNSETAACRSCRKRTIGCRPYLDGTSAPKSWGFPWRHSIGHEQEGCQDYYPERGVSVS